MTNSKLSFLTRLSSTVVCVVALAPAKSATLETEPTVTFSKVAFADTELEENQDRITNEVWLTRDDSMGLYNAAIESAYIQHNSPLGTEWAKGTTDDDLSSLNFGTWFNAVNARPPDNLNLDLVMRIPADNAYYNFRFTEWGGFGTGGTFTYIRSLNPLIVPEPSSVVMIAMAVVGLVGWRARRR